MDENQIDKNQSQTVTNVNITAPPKKRHKHFWVLGICIFLLIIFGITYSLKPIVLIGKINRQSTGIFSNGWLELNNMKTILEFNDDVSFIDQAKFYENSGLIDSKSPSVIIKKPNQAGTKILMPVMGDNLVSKVYKFDPKNVAYIGTKPTSELQFEIKLSDAITKLFASKVFKEKEVDNWQNIYSSANAPYTVPRESSYENGVWNINADFGLPTNSQCLGNDHYLVSKNEVEAIREEGCKETLYTNFDIKE